jgi:hypothetical protein
MPPLHTHFIDRLAVLNGFVSGLALYPYIYAVLFQGIENNLSALTLVIILLNNLVWFAYAIHRLLVSVAIAAAFSAIAAGILLFI